MFRCETAVALVTAVAELGLMRVPDNDPLYRLGTEKGLERDEVESVLQDSDPRLATEWVGIISADPTGTALPPSSVTSISSSPPSVICSAAASLSSVSAL